MEGQADLVVSSLQRVWLQLILYFPWVLFGTLTAFRVRSMEYLKFLRKAGACGIITWTCRASQDFTLISKGETLGSYQVFHELSEYSFYVISK